MDFRPADSSPSVGGGKHSPADASAGPQRRVKCFSCGRTEAVSSDDLLGYLQTGWPKCCGEVMTYFADGDGPDGETNRAEG